MAARYCLLERPAGGRVHQSCAQRRISSAHPRFHRRQNLLARIGQRRRISRHAAGEVSTMRAVLAIRGALQVRIGNVLVDTGSLPGVVAALRRKNSMRADERAASTESRVESDRVGECRCVVRVERGMALRLEVRSVDPARPDGGCAIKLRDVPVRKLAAALPDPRRGVRLDTRRVGEALGRVVARRPMRRPEGCAVVVVRPGPLRTRLERRPAAEEVARVVGGALGRLGRGSRSRCRAEVCAKLAFGADCVAVPLLAESANRHAKKKCRQGQCLFYF
jgi:hypothetical protein